MAAADPTGLSASSRSSRLTVSEGRRFALTLAGGFAALGALAAWRGRQTLAIILLALAGVAAICALAVPTRLGGAQHAWMALGLAISRVTTSIFYSVLYLLVLTPTGLLRRTIGRSPLSRDVNATSYWLPREAASPENRRHAMERQF